MRLSRFLSPLLLCCLGALAHGEGWQDVDLWGASQFSDRCLYRAQLESYNNWYLAMGGDSYTLTFSPPESVTVAEKYQLVINSSDKKSPYVSTPKGGQPITFGTSKLQKWCPTGQGFISANLYATSLFHPECLHRVRAQDSSFKYLVSGYSADTLQLAPEDFAGVHQTFSVSVIASMKYWITTLSLSQKPSWTATREIDALCKNVNWENQPLSDSSMFKTNCIYQVRLDNTSQWQQVYGSDTSGFDLYINPYIPSKVDNGVARTISWITKNKYTTTEGTDTTTGTVTAMRYFCPSVPLSAHNRYL